MQRVSSNLPNPTQLYTRSQSLTLHCKGYMNVIFCCGTSSTQRARDTLIQRQVDGSLEREICRNVPKGKWVSSLGRNSSRGAGRGKWERHWGSKLTEGLPKACGGPYVRAKLAEGLPKAGGQECPWSTKLIAGLQKTRRERLGRKICQRVAEGK